MDDEWPDISLADLYEFSSGLSKAREDFGFGHPFVSFKDVFDNYFLPYRLNELVNSSAEEQEAFSVRRGDVLLTRTSETVDELGMSSVALTDYPGATFNGFTKRLRPKNALIYPEYATYYFRSSVFRRQMFALSNMSTRASLNNEMLGRLTARVPPMAIQVAIGDTLKVLDDKIDLDRRMAKTLEAVAQTLFRSWFVDFDPVHDRAEGRPGRLADTIASVFPDSFDNDGLPRGWKSSTVAVEFDLTMGQSPPGVSYNESGDGVPLYQGRTDFGFRFPARRVFTTAPTRMAAKGDTLVSVRAPVGALNMAYEPCCLGRGVAAIRHRSGSASYTYYALQAMQPSIAAFEDDGTVFGAINKDAFARLPALRPDAVVVAAFHEITTAIDERITKLFEEIEVVATLRDAILPRLMSGELRVADAPAKVSAA